MEHIVDSRNTLLVFSTCMSCVLLLYHEMYIKKKRKKKYQAVAAKDNNLEVMCIYLLHIQLREAGVQRSVAHKQENKTKGRLPTKGEKKE